MIYKPRSYRHYITTTGSVGTVGSNIFIIRDLIVTTTLHLWLLMLHRHITFGNNRLSDIVRTKIYWHFEHSLWPWPWIQNQIFWQDALAYDDICSKKVLVVKGSAVQNIQSKNTYFRVVCACEPIAKNNNNKTTNKKQQKTHKQKPITATSNNKTNTHKKTNNNNNKIDSNMSHQMIMSSFTVDQIQPVLAFKSTPMFSLQMFNSNRNASIFAAISVYASDRKCQIAEVQK